MNVQQLSIKREHWKKDLESVTIHANIFLLFVSPEFKEKHEFLKFLNTLYPKATIIGCSTAGEISGVTVSDETISLTAIQLKKTRFKKASIEIETMDCSYKVGLQLADKLISADLKHVLVFSDGLNVNGADLVAGLKDKMPNISITGGLAGDGANFNETFVINDVAIVDKTIVALGFYGNDLKIGYSSKGGWDSFGIERLVTKSDKNVLYELDGLPALVLYKSFLGAQAKNLPSSGLLFPISIRVTEDSIPVVRNILAINEEDQSLTFAGNIP